MTFDTVMLFQIFIPFDIFTNVQEVTILSAVSKMPGVTLRRNWRLLTLCWSQLTLLPGLRAGGWEEPAGLERPVLAAYNGQT